MKPAYLLAFFLTALSTAFGQNNTHVRVNIKTDSLIKRVELTNLSKTVSILKPYTDGAEFSFNSNFPDQFTLKVETENKKFITGFWLDSGEINIDVSLIKELKTDTVTGSYFYGYSQNTMKTLRATTDPQKLKNLYNASIIENLSNPFSLNLTFMYLNEIQDDKERLGDLQKSLLKIPEAIRSHVLYNIVTMKLNAFLNIKAINFQKYTFLNTKKDSSKIRPGEGKTTVLDFWFSSCLPCIKDHEVMKENYEFLKTKKVEIVGISTDKEYAKWIKYINEKKIGWSNYLIVDSLAASISKDLGLEAFPTYILINDHGDIIRNFLAFSELLAYFKKN